VALDVSDLIELVEDSFALGFRDTDARVPQPERGVLAATPRPMTTPPWSV
jgi:hypothetical protein